MATAAFLIGAALVTSGAALVFLPAGFVVGGLALMLGAVFYVRGSRGEA